MNSYFCALLISSESSSEDCSTLAGFCILGYFYILFLSKDLALMS